MSNYDTNNKQFLAVTAKEKDENDIAQNAENVSDAIIESDNELVTPIIPREVYDNLPEFLRRACTVFTIDRERDIFLTGALGILSGCFDNVTGCYDGRTVYPNLFAFIIAGAGNGKGVLNYAKKLGEALHKAIKQAVLSPTDNPVTQARRTLYIPANSSSAAFIKMLIDNGGSGIICETEADALTDTLKQDWGGYSPLMRGSFHHEPVTYSRKQNNELIEIENPRLSIVLSGTPGQFRKLISSIENGLFSRFLFYGFNDPKVWKDVSPAGRPNLTSLFNSLSEEVLRMVDRANATPITFEMSSRQWESLNSEFRQRLELTQHEDDEAGGSVYRLGLITFRIAMLLTTIRAIQSGNIAGSITCSLTDFNTAMVLSGIYLEHALHMMDTLPQSVPLDPVLARFYAALPNEFTKAEAIQIGARMGIKPRTVGKYLPLLVGKQLEKVKHGCYKKR